MFLVYGLILTQVFLGYGLILILVFWVIDWYDQDCWVMDWYCPCFLGLLIDMSQVFWVMDWYCPCFLGFWLIWPRFLGYGLILIQVFWVIDWYWPCLFWGYGLILTHVCLGCPGQCGPDCYLLIPCWPKKTLIISLKLNLFQQLFEELKTFYVNYYSIAHCMLYQAAKRITI